MSPSPSLCCSLQNSPKMDKVLENGIVASFRKSADLLVKVPKRKFIWVRIQASFTHKGGGGVADFADFLVEFCQENALVITNTLFQQHKRRLYIWTSPDGQHWNQIDYVLCSLRWRSSIQSAKTRPGADCGSDHELLIAKFRLKLKKVGKTTRPLRYDLNKIPAMIFVFWMLSFKPTLLLSSFTFVKRLFSSSLLSAIRVVSSAYLRLLIFLPAILIPACASSSPEFLMMYSA